MAGKDVANEQISPEQLGKILAETAYNNKAFDIKVLNVVKHVD